MSDPPVVMVINTNPDVVLVMHIAEIRAGLDVGSVLRQHDPQVVVYDVVAPLARSWRFLEHLRATSFKGRRFVLTSPNAKAVTALVGKDEKIYEILDAGGDVDAIVQAVREAVRARPVT